VEALHGFYDPKKIGVMLLDSLRTVVHFLVDCNYAFKHIVRKIMWTAEKAKVLAPEQYKDHKQQKVMDLVVNKALTYDPLWQLKRPRAICSNNTCSYYDLIGHAQTSLAMQRMGVPKSMVDCMFTTLQIPSTKSAPAVGTQIPLMKAHVG
jgi:hypothetical protein